MSADGAGSSEVLDFLRGVRSVRRFSPKAVPAEVLDEALRVAQRAPSASNLQQYHVIEIQDVALRERVFDAMVTQDFVRRAPVVFLTCIDWSKMAWLAAHAGAERIPSGEVARFLGAVEGSIFTHHLALALMAQGLGVCCIASPYTNLREVARLLEIPPGSAMPLHMVVAGYPAEAPGPRPRLPMTAVRSVDRYVPPNPDELRDYFESAERALMAEEYFAKYDTGAVDLGSHLRTKFGAVGHGRTWEPMAKDLETFL
jgi:FMN reductase (NADPH)